MVRITMGEQEEEDEEGDDDEEEDEEDEDEKVDEEEEEEEAYARGLTPRTCVGREPRRPSSIGKTC